MPAPVLRLEFHFPAGTKHAPGTCIACGCRDERACEGGCFWIDPSHLICSACVALALDAVDVRGRSTVTESHDEGGAFVALVVPLRKPPARRKRRT